MKKIIEKLKNNILYVIAVELAIVIYILFNIWQGYRRGIFM